MRAEQLIMFPTLPLETAGKLDGRRSSEKYTAGIYDPDGLRPYQASCRFAVQKELDRVRATLAVLFTGAGKTQIAGAVAKHWKNGRVLWIAHRDELLGQAQKRIEKMTGELTSLEQAGWYASGTRIVVGSVQTLRGKRLERFPRDAFGLIITDEAHHAPSKSYRAVYDHFESAKIFGITATADRLDGIGQHNVFDSVAFRKDVDDGIDEGYLVPFVPKFALIDSVNLARVKTVAGDLQLDALEEQILKGAAAIVDATLGVCGDRRSLTFTPGVASAHKVCDTHNERNPGSAHVVDGKTNPDKRREIFKAHRRGDFQHLINCMVATEGYDDVGIRMIVNARPTKSRSLATQIWGRGLRVLDGIGELPTVEDRVSAIAASAKPNCLFLDITGEPGKHSLISPLDLLAGRFTPAEVEKAKELVAKAPQEARQALEEARVVVRGEEEERTRLAARAAAEAEVRKREGMWDPFQDGAAKDPDAMRPAFLAKPSTPRQKAWAKDNYLDPNLSCERLHHLFKLNIMRRRFEKADFRLLGMLRQRGLPAAMTTTRQEAIDMLSAYNRGQR